MTNLVELLRDLHDVVVSDTEPSTLENGDALLTDALWLDTGSSPNLWKRWDGSQFVTVGSAGGGGSGTGRLLARTIYDPASDESKSSTSATFGDADATNLVLPDFDAPASGVVLVVLTGWAQGNGSALAYNLRDGSGDIAGTDVRVIHGVNNGVNDPTHVLGRIPARIPVTGLSGTQTGWKWGIARPTGSSTAQVTGGPTYGPFVMEVYDLTVYDAIDAADVPYDNSTSGLAATDVQAAIDEVDGDLDAHLADSVDAHDASAISNVPSGDLTGTTVQAAVDELETSKAKRRDRLYLPIHRMEIVIGTRTPVPINTRTVGLQLPDGATTYFGLHIDPESEGIDHWSTYDVTLRLANGSATSGDIVVRYDYHAVGGTDSWDGITTVTSHTITMPTTQYENHDELVTSGVSMPTAGKALVPRVGRTAGAGADNLTNAAILFAVILEKAS